MESYAILSWIKYLWENIGLERCSKKGVYACLVELTEVENVEEFWLHFNSSIYRSTNNTGREQINNTNTTGAMHTHDDMIF